MLGDGAFDEALRALDVGLFAPVESQTTDADKRSLLACQLATRELVGSYRYLEIGSHLGGSLLPHLRDPACTAVVSIDKRPAAQPDERGVDFAYPDNSTARMIATLGAVVDDLSKLVTIDGDTGSIDPTTIEPATLCFIDGEHTDTAAERDFRFCLDLLDGPGAIVFHDAPIVYRAIRRCLDHLAAGARPATAYALPSAVFVVEIGDFPIHRSPAVAPLLIDNHDAYLFALEAGDAYRDFAHKAVFRRYRRMRSALRRVR